MCRVCYVPSCPPINFVIPKFESTDVDEITEPLSNKLAYGE